MRQATRAEVRAAARHGKPGLSSWLRDRAESQDLADALTEREAPCTTAPAKH